VRVLDAIDHVQLAAPAGCEDEARRFFGGLLGLDEIEKPASLRPRGGVWFRVGAQQLHVGVEEEHTPARKAHPAFLVARYEELLERLRDAHVEIVDDDTIPGVRRCYASDPWGNRLELISAE
jgi:catechol 2,3-dioxygenase-like lactoylglutathione lyase family enzyme